MNQDIHNDWEAVRRAAANLCRELWADSGTGDFLARIGEVRAAIHRSAEVTRQPWGAVVTVHNDLDRAASGWSERGSGLHRQAEAEAQRVESAAVAERQAAIEATQATIPSPGLYWAKATGEDRWTVVEVTERADGRRFVVHHGDEGSYGAESIAEWGPRLESPTAAADG